MKTRVVDIKKLVAGLSEEDKDDLKIHLQIATFDFVISKLYRKRELLQEALEEVDPWNYEEEITTESNEDSNNLKEK